MKKLAAIFLTVLCLTAISVQSQSRRANPTVDGESGKANKRPPQAAPRPTPDETSAKSLIVIETERGANDKSVIDDGDIIRVETSIVTIPVKVSDRRNRFVSGLNKEDFKVLEDNVEQEIALFSNEQQPFTVALVIDMSYSTKF